METINCENSESEGKGGLKASPGKNKIKKAAMLCMFTMNPKCGFCGYDGVDPVHDTAPLLMTNYMLAPTPDGCPIEMQAGSEMCIYCAHVLGDKYSGYTIVELLKEFKLNPNSRLNFLQDREEYILKLLEPVPKSRKVS